MAIDQYTALENTYQKIAQLSELNLVYLMLTEGQGNKKTTPKVFISQGNPRQSELVVAATTTAAPAKAKESPLEAYIRRAQASLDQNNPAQALRELRDALREEPIFNVLILVQRLVPGFLLSTLIFLKLPLLSSGRLRGAAPSSSASRRSTFRTM